MACPVTIKACVIISTLGHAIWGNLAMVMPMWLRISDFETWAVLHADTGIYFMTDTLTGIEKFCGLHVKH